MGFAFEPGDVLGILAERHLRRRSYRSARCSVRSWFAESWCVMMQDRPAALARHLASAAGWRLFRKQRRAQIALSQVGEDSDNHFAGTLRSVSNLDGCPDGG